MTVIVVDVRGCFARRETQPADVFSPDAERMRLAGRQWRSLVFHRTGLLEDVPVFVADTAAIGDASWPYDPLLLPSGWHAPTATSLQWVSLRQRLVRGAA